MGFFNKLFSKSKPEPSPRDILEFNYFYAFEYIPSIIQKYNHRQCPIEKIFDVPDIIASHPNYSPFAKRIEYGLADSKKYPNIKLFAISIPNNGGISQANSAIIVLNEEKKFAQYFTMEISFDNQFAIVSPTLESRNNYGFVSSPEEFTERALQIALGSDRSNNQTNTKKASSNLNSNRIDNIEMLLEAGVEWFQNDFLPLTGKAKLECALLLGSTLIRCISSDDIAKAINSNPEWANILDNSSIKLRLTDYQHAYDHRVATLDSPFRMRLLDFAAKFGKMKIATFNDKSGNPFKAAAFIDGEGKITIAYMHTLTEEEKVPAYISLHRKDYGIRQTAHYNYELFSYSKEEAENLSFFVLIANYLLLKPLEDIEYFNSNDKVSALGSAGYNIDIILDKAITAFRASRDKIYALGKELKLLPEAIPTKYENLP